MFIRETNQERVEKTLARLGSEAKNVSRQSKQGQLIESLGCLLSGRNGGWWPSENGVLPEIIEAHQPATHSWMSRGVYQ